MKWQHRGWMAGVVVAMVVGGLEWCAGRESRGAEEIVLASEGRSDYAIVVANDAAVPEKFAAEELQKYLMQISGVRLPLAGRAATERVICVGKGSVAGEEASRWESELKGRGEDGYVMGTSGKRVVLAGNSPRASLYAVYHFLEKYLGCGWCVPGDDTVPRQGTVCVRAFRDAIGPPAFTMRQLVTFYGGARLLELNLKQVDWMAKNRIDWVHPAPNGPYKWEQDKSREVYVPEVKRRGLKLEVGGHTFNTWIPADKYAAAHPEWFAVNAKGQRATDGSPRAGLCISNPEVVRTVAENMIQWLDENPEVDAVDLWHNDSKVYCHCPQCAPGDGDEEGKWPAYTRSYIRFVNQVARAVEKRHPRVLIQLLAYFHTREYPVGAEPLADNILVGLCLYNRLKQATLLPLDKPPQQTTMRPIETSPQPLDRLLRPQLSAWHDRAKHFNVYEYYTVGTSFKIWSMVSMIEEDMRYFRRLGIDGISSDMWGTNWFPTNMYAFGKLAWDPKLQGSDLIADFCRRYYGKASGTMNAYWSLLEESLRESWKNNTRVEGREKERVGLIKKALSEAEDQGIQERILAAAKLQGLALGK